MSNPPTGSTGSANDEAPADGSAAAAMAPGDEMNRFILVKRKRFIRPTQRQSAGFKTAAAYLNADANDDSVLQAMQATKMKSLVDAVAAATADSREQSQAIGPLADAPIDVKTRSIEGFEANTIHDNRYAISVPFTSFAEKHIRTGMPVCSPRKVVVDLVAKIIHSLHKADAHGVCVPYDDGSTAQTIAQAHDLPEDAAALAKYAKDFRFNKRTSKVIFHLRIQSSISLQQLKDNNSPTHSDIKKDFRRFLIERGYWVMTQGCAATRLVRQGFLLNSHAADNITRLKEQLTDFWLENDVAFNPDLWQLSPRTTKTRKAGTKGITVEHTAVWLDCDPTIARPFRDACHLIITKSITSEYPLLWNLTFIPVSRAGDLGNDVIFRAAQSQQKFNNERFTFPVEGWNPNIDPHQDAPFIDYGTSTEPDVLATRSLATLLVSQATAVLPNGETVQLLSKIQVPENRTGVWNFQGWKDTADETRNWIDTVMVAKIREWTSHADNSKEGYYTGDDIGAPVRSYMQSGNSRPVPGDDARGQGTQHERWTRAVKEAGGKPAPGGSKTGAATAAPTTMAYTDMMRGGPKRHKNRGVVTAATYATMVQQPLPESFPSLTNSPTMSYPAAPAPMVGISAGDATTDTSSLTTSLEEIKRAQEEVRAQQVAYQLQRESDREELRVAQEKFTQATAEAETEQDNRREELRTSIENQMREQVRQQFEEATQGWNTTLSEQLASATSASTDQLIKMVTQQREEDQRTIATEFGKISDQIAELNKIVVVLAQQVAAVTGTQLSSLIVTPAGIADDDMTEAISGAKKQKNSDGLPSAPNISALIPPRV